MVAGVSNGPLRRAQENTHTASVARHRRPIRRRVLTCWLSTRCGCSLNCQVGSHLIQAAYKRKSSCSTTTTHTHLYLQFILLSFILYFHQAKLRGGREADPSISHFFTTVYVPPYTCRYWSRQKTTKVHGLED